MQRTLGCLTLGGLLAIGAGCRAPEPAPYMVHVNTIVVPAPARVENGDATLNDFGPVLTVLGDFDVEVAQGSVESPLFGARQETAAFLRLANQAYQGKNYEFALQCAQRVRTLNPDCTEAAGLATLALDAQRTSQPNGEWGASVERLRNCRSISDQQFRDVLLRLRQTESDNFAAKAARYLTSTKGDSYAQFAREWRLVTERIQAASVPEGDALVAYPADWRAMVDKIVLHFYDVKDLVKADAAPRERDGTVQLAQFGYSPPESEPSMTPVLSETTLLEAVRKGVAPESWNNEKTALEIKNRVLVVSQSEAVHASIDVFLQALRACTARATQQVLRIHPVADLAPSGFAAEDLVELMESTIEPDTWGSSGNSVNTHSHNLVIFAPERVQRQVGDLLNDLRKARK